MGGGAYFYCGPSLERFFYIDITKSMDLSTLILFYLTLISVILIFLVPQDVMSYLFLNPQTAWLLIYKCTQYIIYYPSSLHSDHLTPVSFLILRDNTLGQTLSSFIIYNSISSWNFSGFFVCFGVYHLTRELFSHMKTSPLPVKCCKF